MRLERVADFLRVEIPGDRMNVAEVNLEGDRLDANPAQVAIANQVNQSCLVRDVLEEVTEQPFVAAVRCRGNAKDAGVLKISEHALITFAERMMSLVNDDQREVIGSKTPPPGFAHQGLHGGNDDRRIKTGSAFRRLDLGHDTGGPQNLVSRLFEQFLAMGKDKSAPRLIVFGDPGEKQRLAAAGGANNQLPAKFVESPDGGLNGLPLIRAKGETRFALALGDRGA